MLSPFFIIFLKKYGIEQQEKKVKVGDMVWVCDGSRGESVVKQAILISLPAKKTYAGYMVEVLIEGNIKEVLLENVMRDFDEER